ncbi:MAG: DUF711 family protein, partial [Clostridia bacterium]|nr:DUF711 family protein [Clostridia bacterium]
MINNSEIFETLNMINSEHLDVRTITMGISLLDCASEDYKKATDKVYDKITRYAENLVETGCDIEKEFGIPIINKRIAVTPISHVASSCGHYVDFAKALDRAADTTGVNFIGGYSALVAKGYTASDRLFVESIPEALAETKKMCSSVNVASTKAGINMDAVRQMGQVIKKAAELDDMACAKLVVFANAVEDNPFMAGAFHGTGEGECVINVG